MNKKFCKIAQDTKKIYDKNAEIFHQQRDKTLFEQKWLDLFSSLLPQNAHILDVGCGSGDPISKYLMSKKFQVTGIDFSEELIKIAESLFPDSRWLVQDMRELTFKEKVNGIIAWNSFFHLNSEDQLKALDHFNEALNDSGVLMFTAGPDNGEVLGHIAHEEVYHCSLSHYEYERELAKRSLEIVHCKLNDKDCRSHSIYLAQKNIF